MNNLISETELMQQLHITKLINPIYRADTYKACSFYKLSHNVEFF